MVKNLMASWPSVGPCRPSVLTWTFILLVLNGCIVLTAAKKKVQLSRKEASLGEDLRLFCKYPNNTYPDGEHGVEWHKNGVKLERSRNKEKHKFRKGGKVLKVKKLGHSDSGMYVCRKKSVDSSSNHTVISYNISIQQPRRGRDLRFKSEDKILNQRNTVKPAGSDITFDCQAIGEGPIRYKWYKGGEPLLSRRTDSNLKINKPELKLKNLVRSDSANYTCVAQNRYKNITTNMVLFVQERVRSEPYIERATMKNQTKYVGDNVSIVCYELITGTIPDFHWLKWTGPLNETLLTNYLQQESGVGAVDDKVAKVIHGKFYRPTKKDATWGDTGNGRSVVRGVECVLTNVQVKDSGFYTCIATNHIGEDYASMYLEVKERKEKPAQLSNNTSNNGRHMQIIIVVLGVLVLIALIIFIWLLVTWKFRGSQQSRSTPPVVTVQMPQNTDSAPLLSSSERRKSDPHYTVVDPEIRTGMYLVLDDVPMLMNKPDEPSEMVPPPMDGLPDATVSTEMATDMTAVETDLDDESEAAEATLN